MYYRSIGDENELKSATELNKIIEEKEKKYIEIKKNKDRIDKSSKRRANRWIFGGFVYLTS